MNLKAEFLKQKEIVLWMDSRFRGEYPRDRKTNIALCCFDITLEHHKAICVLYESGLYGSMYALLRVLYESFIRGYYLARCASEDEISKYEKNDELKKSFGQLVKAVEEQLDFNDGFFEEILRLSYKKMSSFVHTGYQHLIRRQINKRTGVINYPDEEIVYELKFCGFIVLLSGDYLSAIIQDGGTLRKEMMDKIQNYSKS